MVEQTYKDIYNKFHDELLSNCPEVLNSVREEAYEVFERMGFPTMDQERYRRSNIPSLFEPEYGVNIKHLTVPVNGQPYRCEVPGLHTHTFYVVNDVFVSDIEKEEFNALKEKGVIFGSLRTIAKEQPELVKKYYAKIAPHKSEAVIAFNTTFAQDGFFLYVPKNVTIEKPIQLINVMHADFDFLANSRNLIILDEGAEAKVIVCDHSEKDRKFLSNRVTEIFIGKNARYSHHKMVDSARATTSIGGVYIKQMEGSTSNISDIVLNAGFVRNDIHIDLAEKYAETTLCGVCIGDEHDHIDNDTFIEHSASNCKSTELFKYILDDCAVGSFAGRILVDQDSQKTEAFQSNKNICSSTHAKMYTKPQLVIYADDVKCSHGATVGQIDDGALFYLRSRGISEKEAKMLLKLAFTNDIIEKIDIEPLRNRIKVLVEKRFRGESHRCTICNSCK